MPTQPLSPLLLLLFFGLLMTGCVAPPNSLNETGADGPTGEQDPPQVRITTSMGSFDIELFAEESPITTDNFLRYIDEGFYDGDDELGATSFHRIIADFMVQGGGLTESGSEKATHSAIRNEATDSGLSNSYGTLAMARTNNPDSATTQFFINVVDNSFLDPGEMSDDGYAVFAEVISGMDVVDAMGMVATDSNDAPLQPVLIEDAERL